jgi:hypothetical protein
MTPSITASRQASKAKKITHNAHAEKPKAIRPLLKKLYFLSFQVFFKSWGHFPFSQTHF